MNRKEQEGQKTQYLRAIFDAFPHPAFIVDAELRIQDFNVAAKPLLGSAPAMALHRRSGEALHCIHADLKGCGEGVFCKHCIIRRSAFKALNGKGTHRELHKGELRSGNDTLSIELLITSSRLPDILPPRVLLVLEEVTKPAMAHKPRHGHGQAQVRD